MNKTLFIIFSIIAFCVVLLLIFKSIRIYQEKKRLKKINAIYNQNKIFFNKNSNMNTNNRITKNIELNNQFLIVTRQLLIIELFDMYIKHTPDDDKIITFNKKLKNRYDFSITDYIHFSNNKKFDTGSEIYDKTRALDFSNEMLNTYKTNIQNCIQYANKDINEALNYIKNEIINLDNKQNSANIEFIQKMTSVTKSFSFDTLNLQ